MMHQLVLLDMRGRDLELLACILWSFCFLILRLDDVHKPFENKEIFSAPTSPTKKIIKDWGNHNNMDRSLQRPDKGNKGKNMMHR